MNTTLKITTPSDREIVISRTFDAPRRLVWQAMSKPEFLKRWLFGPPGWSMTVCDEDQKVGGKFRYAWSNVDGREMDMSGIYREVVAPERVVRTESFEFGCEAQAGEQVGTMVLTEQGGKTMMTVTVLYPSKEARDGALASGMDQGLDAGYTRLDEILESLK